VKPEWQVLHILNCYEYFVSMRIFYIFICCSLMLVSGCIGAQEQVAPEMASLQIVPPDTIEHLAPRKPKRVFEFVQIDGESYAVPYPWRGKKIAQKSPDRSTLQQIPIEFTKDQSTLFVEQEACAAFIAMAQAAREDDVHLLVHSAFRSVWYQRKIFTNLMAEGRTWDDLIRYVAPPGYSEHMLGIAVDLYPSNWRFASTPEYAWLKEHAAEYHFVESYPEFNQDGFPWEAWHWRYVAPESNDTEEPIEENELLPQTFADYIESEQKQ
jgi:D-alanyl-D-alanine carboxypeptidase